MAGANLVNLEQVVVALELGLGGRQVGVGLVGGLGIPVDLLAGAEVLVPLVGRDGAALARRLAATVLGPATLRAAAPACRGCDLHARATQVVFGEGRPDARLVLIGEQLGGTAMAGRRGGAVCRTLRLAQCPFAHAPAWLSSFDVVVLTSDADFGPWPIFDALHAGVPLVALPAG